MTMTKKERRRLKMAKEPMKPKMNLSADEFQTFMKVWNRMLAIYKDRVGLPEDDHIVNFWGGKDMHRGMWLDALRELKHEEYERAGTEVTQQVFTSHIATCQCPACVPVLPRVD